MSQSPRPAGVLAATGQFITRTRNFVLNTLFILLVLLLTIGMLSTCQSVSVPNDAALIVNPQGIIVDQRSIPQSLTEVVSFSDRPVETELQDLLLAIRTAAGDDAIKMLILNLENLAYVSPAHAHRLGAELARFSETGKRIASYGDFYSQSHLHIASFADAVYMHPLGQALLTGYGGSNLYFKELIDRFDVNVHVYRAGEFKSAVEPFTRSDMSAEARLALEQVYQDLWQSLIEDVAANRAIPAHELQSYADDIAAHLSAAQGDAARMALEAHLVDELLTPDQATVRFAEQVGYADAGRQQLNAIDFARYLSARDAAPGPGSEGNIALVHVQGPIMLEALQSGVAAANDLVELIRQARFDDNVRALVVRVDSPGGSQFASELIRQELELVQLSGKPVVASFGSQAASGGYWVSATADEIVSEETTITGSIGNFSILTTFEKTLAKYGVYSDGVGTAANTLGFGMLTGVNAEMAKVLQIRTEQGYEQFVNLVAKGRDQDPEQIKAIAGGRVWSGAAALELGLVDHLGGLQEALARAASLAELSNWGVQRLQQPRDPRGAIIAELLGVQAHQSGLRQLTGPFAGLGRQLEQLQALFSDPRGIYAYCEFCLPNLLQ